MVIFLEHSYQDDSQLAEFFDNFSTYNLKYNYENL